MMHARAFLAAALGIASVLAAGSAATAQQSVEEFYRGKTITLLIGHPPGGSYDLFARLAAAHIGKHIPGRPTVQVQSRPGGGGMVAAGWFYANAPRDGSTIALLPDSLAHMQVLQPANAAWKTQEMRYIGSFANVNETLVRRKDAPAKTIDDLRKTEMILGCSGKVSNAYMNPAIMNAHGGYKFRITCGYPGSSDIIIAINRGELDGYMGTWNQWRLRPELKDGSFVPMFQAGLKRHKEIPDLPLMQELFDKPDLKEVMIFISAGAAIGRALVAPPGVPAERLAALRAAFDKVVLDPDFLADAAKRHAEVDPLPGPEVQTISDGIVNAPKSVVQMAVDALK
jgi:tripartite-type tricarboxylate transporter receptor subunit TctC